VTYTVRLTLWIGIMLGLSVAAAMGRLPAC